MAQTKLTRTLLSAGALIALLLTTCSVVWAQVAERQRRVFLESQLMAVEGRMESAEGSQHLIATRLEDLSSLLGGVATSSRDFR